MKKGLLAEEIRILENHIGTLSVWDKWGTYVSERAWGTVREDYSEDGSAWTSFPFDHANKRAYRWGEDGIAGISDRYQVMALTLGLWNGNDPILKERLFGVAPDQGNHGEDVKELYFYLDNTPSFSYMKYLYKYPHAAFPYQDLIDENTKRSKDEPEYELLDTGLFDNDEYFDVFVEYAKINHEELVMKITVANRGKKVARIDVLPQVTLRNVWSWTPGEAPKPKVWEGKCTDDFDSIELDDGDSEPFPMLDVEYKLGKRYIYASKGAEILFTENETNHEALGTGSNASPFTKDAFNREIVYGEKCTNPEKNGTKACFAFRNQMIEAESEKVYYIRLSEVPLKDPIANIDPFIGQKKEECDEFYDHILRNNATAEEKKIQRLAIANQLWSRQLYLFIANRWLNGDDPNNPASAERVEIRNSHWRHLISKHVIVMPDKWEYPWFAAWDLAFHAVTIGLYDIELAKDQLWLLLTEEFQHPNGQIPAYEWEFSHLNPPIQGWVALRLFEMEKEQKGKGDREFLHKCFEKLVVNFVWWVNKVDTRGNNVFEGGFLGLDNITVFDRSKPLPNGGFVEQSDASGWMGMFCLNLMRMAMELAKQEPSFEVMINKFFRHFVYVAAALTDSEKRTAQNWNKEDGFFYDVLCRPDGTCEQLPIRSLVGIIPIFALEVITDEELRQFESFHQEFNWFRENRSELLNECLQEVVKDGKKTYVLSLVGKEKEEGVMKYVWDKNEFRSPYGLRSLSKFHEKNPLSIEGAEIHYAPAESKIDMFGGNSNWRGPIWFPINYLLLQTLRKLDKLNLDKIVATDPDGETATHRSILDHYSEALISIFKLDENGVRPCTHTHKKFQDRHFKDYLLFHEYFHGDTGAGLGASHQTGWTALIANIIQEHRAQEPED